MDKQNKKQLEAEIISAAQEILKRHNATAATKVQKHIKASGKKIAKKFLKAVDAEKKKKGSVKKKKAPLKPKSKVVAGKLDVVKNIHAKTSK